MFKTVIATAAIFAGIDAVKLQNMGPNTDAKAAFDDIASAFEGLNAETWATATPEDLIGAFEGWMEKHDISLEDLGNISKEDVAGFLEEHRIDPKEVCMAVKEKIESLERETGVTADSILQKLADHDANDEFETADDIKAAAMTKMQELGLEGLFQCFMQQA